MIVIGIVFLGAALLMVFLQIEELRMQGWRPWGSRRPGRSKKTKYRVIPADWNRIQKETELERKARKK
ncbi:MAG: hypothetical protein E7238_00380 [Sarcina sp.]|nr:hypothetical protein [Sarcina sp.]